MRTHVVESMDDKIGAARWVTNDTDTTYVNDKVRGADNCGWGNDTLINAKNGTAEAANGGGGVVQGAGVDTHTTPRQQQGHRNRTQCPPHTIPPGTWAQERGQHLFLNFLP